MFADASGRAPPRPPFALHSAASMSFSSEAECGLDHEASIRHSSSSGISVDGFDMSPLNPASSPYSKSPWTLHEPPSPSPASSAILLGSLVREDGHIYSLATSRGLLYTGSDSKNIRVWKSRREFSGFKSSSGLVKAIVPSRADSRIFTGHQDGKVRVWRASSRHPRRHVRAGTLPRLRDYLRSSLRPGRKSAASAIRHRDAVSCLSLTAEGDLLYSGSWDRTVKVWRLADSRCLESVPAHDDAVNAVVADGPAGLVFTGSADGSVKAWRREMQGKSSRHALVRTLLEQESAVTSLAAAPGFLYCGSSDGAVYFWHLEGDRRLERGGELRGHALAVLCVATAGSMVVSGSADKTMCVWRRGVEGEHECVAVLSGHLGPVKCLAVERDEEESGAGGVPAWVLYSGSLDKSVNVWRVTEGVWDPRRSSVGDGSCVGGFTGSFSSPSIGRY